MLCLRIIILHQFHLVSFSNSHQYIYAHNTYIHLYQFDGILRYYGLTTKPEWNKKHIMLKRNTLTTKQCVYLYGLTSASLFWLIYIFLLRICCFYLPSNGVSVEVCSLALQLINNLLSQHTYGAGRIFFGQQILPNVFVLPFNRLL